MRADTDMRIIESETLRGDLYQVRKNNIDIYQVIMFQIIKTNVEYAYEIIFCVNNL